MEEHTQKLITFLLVPLFVVFFLLVIFTRIFQADSLFGVNFFDVGQGDSTFIETASGKQVLIDGGPSDKILSLLGQSMPFFDRTIDVVIISHPHADHVNGLIDVLKRYKVEAIIMADVVYDSGSFRTLKDLIEQKKIPVIQAQAGKRIYLDSATIFDIFWPMGQQSGKSFAEGFGQSGQTLNDTSIVGMIQYVKTKILFTGDAGVMVENQILPRYELGAEVLKVGHHGSKYASSQQFLEEVLPKYAIISVGKNSYGHPTQDVLGRLSQVGAQVFRTDIDQSLRFTSDGFSLSKQ